MYLSTTLPARAWCVGVTFLLLNCIGQIKSSEENRDAGILPSDIVVVTGIAFERYEIIQAARNFRPPGFRAIILVGDQAVADVMTADTHAQEHLETYLYYPDRSNNGNSFSLRGDTRWTMAPLLAHRHLSQPGQLPYKWMLLGDDDTMWLMPGVLRLLWNYDSNLPYAVHDYGVDGPFADNYHENPTSIMAACLPCHFNTHGATAAMRGFHENLPRVPAANISKSCPCTPEDACELRSQACLQHVTRKHPAKESESDRTHIGQICGVLHLQENRIQKTEAPPARSDTLPCARPWIQGGAGVALSRGLISALVEDPVYEKCLADASFYCDKDMSHCLWLRGNALTTPGLGLLHGSSHADYRFQVFDHEGPDREKLENPMAAASDNTSCTSFHCKWLLRNAVSYHLHFKRRSMSDNIALAKNMADSHQKFHSTPHGNLNGSNRRLRSGQESDGHSNSDTKLQLAVQALWQKPSAE